MCSFKPLVELFSVFFVVFLFFYCSLDFRLSLFSLIIIPSVVELVVYVCDDFFFSNITVIINL